MIDYKMDKVSFPMMMKLIDSLMYDDEIPYSELILYMKNIDRILPLTFVPL